MSRILWHNVIIILTLFPGIVILLINRIPFLKRKNEMDKYAVCLAADVFINLYMNDRTLALPVLLLFLCPCILFILEYLLKDRGKKKIAKLLSLRKQMKKPFYVMLAYPVFEEFIYRSFVYQILGDSDATLLAYLLLSSGVFVFAHFFTQHVKSLYKIPFAVLEGLIYFYTKNIAFCIIIHMAFNMFVYAYNETKYSRNMYG